MKYMLDSNVVIAVALATGDRVRRRMAEHEEGDFVISAVAYAENAQGTARGKPPTLPQLQAFIEEVPVLPFDEGAARMYAKIPFKRGGFVRLFVVFVLVLGVLFVLV